MRSNKFLPFLIISLTLTAFLAGYIMVSRGLNSDYKSKTGTILDKFDEKQGTTNKEQGTEEVKIFPVSSVKVVSISNSADRKGIVYFEKNTGKLLEFNFEDGREQTVSNTVLPNFLSSVWSPVKSEVLSSFYSPDGTKIKYHNYDTGKTVALNSTIRSTAFSTDGGLIAYYTSGTASSSIPSEAGKIYIAQPDGTYPKKIFDTRIADLEVFWPIKDRISFKTPDDAVFVLSEEGDLTKVLETNINLSTKWSIGGSKILFSWGSDPSGPELWVKDIESKSERDLNILATASKCAWSIDSINVFCVVAKTPSIDEIYQINTNTGDQKLVAEPAISIKDLFLSALENYLVFTNAGDEKLYGVGIEQ